MFGLVSGMGLTIAVAGEGGGEEYGVEKEDGISGLRFHVGILVALGMTVKVLTIMRVSDLLRYVRSMLE